MRDCLEELGLADERKRGLENVPYGLKRVSMFGTWAVFGQSCEVFGRAIALIPRELVLRINSIQFNQVGVAGDFRQNRSGGDGYGASVAVHNGAMGQRELHSISPA